MPNYCWNTTKVIGDFSDVRAFVEAVEGEDGDFRIAKTLVPMPEHVENTTVGTEGKSHHDPTGWYGWALAHWGTKWGDFDTDVFTGTDGLCTVSHTTAWSPMDKAWERISEMFPTLTFVTVWTEEDDSMGSFVCHKGATSGVVNMETPHPSYAEYEDADDDTAYWDEREEMRLKARDELLAFAMGMVS